MDEPVGTPVLIGGQRERGVAGIAAQRVLQPWQQIVTIVEPAIPVEDVGSIVAVASAIQRNYSCVCVHDFFLGSAMRREAASASSGRLVSR